MIPDKTQNPACGHAFLPMVIVCSDWISGWSRVFFSIELGTLHFFTHPAADRKNSFFLASAKWPEPTVLPQLGRQNWSSGFDADLC